MVLEGTWRRFRLADLKPGKFGLLKVAPAAAGLLVIVVALILSSPAEPVPPLLGPPISVGYIERHIDRPPPLNNEEAIPDDMGLRGAELGIKDSNASGRFVGVAVALKPTVVAPDADIKAAAASLISKEKPTFLLVNAPAKDLLAIADMPEARDLVIFNISATDTDLRDKQCRANVLHTAPSRAMLTDALLQFLTFKHWTRVLLVSGPHPDDKLYADSLRRSIKKFGGKIVGERTYDAHGGDVRETALHEFILLTRGPDRDVVAVADEADEFGTSMVYNTDMPRPVVGTQGLTPTAWGRPVEAWAAVQLQNRFRKLAGRDMRPVDYAGWMAAHAVGEAAVQLKSADPAAIRKLLQSPSFELGGFKGRQLSFRAWNGQLREPIFNLWPNAVVASAPMQGFMHPKTDLDTLGLDEPESSCKARRS